MFAILKRDWKMKDGETGKETIVPRGRHEIERIPNPLGYVEPWLVLKGTKIGAAENFWRSWRKGMVCDRPRHPNYGNEIDWGDWEIAIEE